MRNLFRCAGALALLGLGSLAATSGADAAGPANAAPAATAVAVPTPATASKPAIPITYGHVYLFRGIGNFLSHGIDTFNTELQARGVPVSVYNHRFWSTVADGVLKQYKTDKSIAPIIIIGHSLGANAAILMANWLGQNGVPVRLVVTFDHVLDMPPLTNSTGELIDYYKPPFGVATQVIPGFKGPVLQTSLEGHDDVTHESIDKTPAYHEVVLNKITEIFKAKPKPAAKG